jgi:Tol biopolymer transport system component
MSVPDGSGLRKIVHKARNHSRFADDPRRVESITLRPRWTPDGKRITFTGESKACGSRHINGCHEAPPTVFVMNPDGSGVHALAKARGRALMAPSMAPAP